MHGTGIFTYDLSQMYVNTLPETNSKFLPLKMDGWLENKPAGFLFGDFLAYFSKGLFQSYFSGSVFCPYDYIRSNKTRTS